MWTSIIMNNQITIVIILYEESESMVFKCLDNLQNFKIIIVDNAGNNLLKKKIEKKYDIYRYVLNPKNYGYSKAANQAIKISNTDFILMFQADGIIKQGDIFELLEAHKKYENTFITSPTYYDDNKDLSYNAGHFPEKNIKKNILNFNGDTCVETVLGSIIMFKKKDMIDIGLYDENFFLYFLDFDLCRRARKMKRSIIQVSKAKVVHAHGQIKVKNQLKKIYIRHFHLTFDELYYFFKVKKHEQIFQDLKKKVPKYIIKMIFNLIILRFSRVVYFVSKIMAFYKFNELFNKKKILNE